MKKLSYLVVATVAILLSSCGSSATLVQQYPKMYEEKPLSIAIMPPINQTSHAEAKDFFYTTMYTPLCEKGYYVFSPYLTMEMFQNESAYDSERFVDADISQFKNVLGADALIFTVIKEWKRNNLLGQLNVRVEYIIRSTKTGETLYKREGDLSLDKTSGFGGWVGMALTVLNTAVTKQVEAGRKCNAFVLGNLPAGKYHPFYGQDMDAPAGDAVIKGSVR